MSNLLTVTGYNSWNEYIKDSSRVPISDIDIKFWYDSLVKGEYPKQSIMVKSMTDGSVKNSFLFNSGDSTLCVTEPICEMGSLKLTSVQSTYYRFLSRNLRGESPMDWLNHCHSSNRDNCHGNNNGEQLIKSLYDAAQVAYPNMCEDELIAYLRTNLLKFVSEYMNEKKMLVNTFPYWRVWSVMHQRLGRALEVIANGDDIKKLMCCSTYDPTAGWGDRLSAALLIKGYLLNMVRASGKYSSCDIEWFANVQFYVGCDTNAGLQELYGQTTSAICKYFDMGTSSAVVHCVSCISAEGIAIATRAAGIEVMQTSIPTPWEVYGVDLPEGDSLVLSNFQGHVDPNTLGESQSRWMNKFLYPFMSEVVTIFSRNGKCSYIHADGYTTKYIDKSGKSKTFTSDIGGDIMTVLKGYGSIYGNASEICFGWDNAIKDKKCSCSRNACRKCESCKMYGVCNEIPCNAATKCYKFMLRSCYVTGNTSDTKSATAV